MVHPATLGARWDRLVAAADVTPITLHSARHTYAELALAAGVRLDVVSRQLGHASSSTTASNYLHDNDEAAAEAAQKVADMLGAGGGAT
ncbi:MAG: tyrosine-type recombinase/integrase [Actinobacteria bacterium]|nr:tyrosine-type recombinase/integrase [Actinomycetota bacterium]